MRSWFRYFSGNGVLELVTLAQEKSVTCSGILWAGVVAVQVLNHVRLFAAP